MLHVTNGSCAGEIIQQTCLPGEVLTWDDTLHEGPAPARLSSDELREVRARFIVACGWASYDEAFSRFARRDAALAGYRDHDEIVLWFEHDLYDQLQLIQILDRFAGQELGAT